MNVQIRLAVENDGKSLRQLYSRQYPIDVTEKFKAVRKYVDKALQTDLKDISIHYNNEKTKNSSLLFVATLTNDNDDSKEEIVGMIGIRPNHGWIDNSGKKEIKKSEKNGNFCKNQEGRVAEIVRFGVKNKYRQMKIGTRLLNHICHICIENEYNMLVATTMNVLNDAILFYMKNSFCLEKIENCGKDGMLKFLRFSKDLNEATEERQAQSKSQAQLQLRLQEQMQDTLTTSKNDIVSNLKECLWCDWIRNCELRN